MRMGVMRRALHSKTKEKLYSFLLLLQESWTPMLVINHLKYRFLIGNFQLIPM